MAEIQVQNVTKLYPPPRRGFFGWKNVRDALLRRECAKPHPALCDVSFTVRDGEWFGILGPNGAGKTTFVDILADILLPTSGRVLVDGVDANQEHGKLRGSLCLADRWWLPSRVSTLNVLRHAATEWGISPEEAERRLKHLIPIFELQDKLDDWVVRLSSGMKDKVRLVAALLARPKVLICDEPTVRLDVTSRRRLYEQLNRYREDFRCTVVWTTHNLYEAEIVCDRVAVLNGCLLAVGEVDDIIESADEQNLEEAVLTLLKRHAEADHRWMEPGEELVARVESLRDRDT